jgi:hypothetical protein
MFTQLQDDQFCDFNFCDRWDYDLRPGSRPDQSDLYAMAFKSRRGDKSATDEFSNTDGTRAARRLLRLFPENSWRSAYHLRTGQDPEQQEKAA